MNLSHLKGANGDAIHAVLCAASYNIRWLLRMVRKKGPRPLFFAHKNARLRFSLGETFTQNSYQTILLVSL